MQAIINHVAADHPAQIPRAREPSLRPPALIRPKIDIGCSPAQRRLQHPRRPNDHASHGVLLGRVNQHSRQSHPQHRLAGSSRPPHTGESHRSPAGGHRHPQSVGPLGKAGQRRACQTFTTKVRGLTTNCNYVLPCPHATPPARACTLVQSCASVDYTASRQGHPPVRHTRP